ncbi:MAG: hypothetical protein J0L66_07385 [Cytophagales bacterium]|nr:hypothetical protein [Cytophagales bacterium]
MRYALLTLALAGCAPYFPLHQVDPLNPTALTVAETPEVTLEVQHAGKQLNHQVFLLSITNNTPDTVRFSPEQVIYYASSKMFSQPPTTQEVHKESYLNSRLLSKRIFASSPNLVLQLANDRVKNMKVVSSLALIATTALVVRDAVKDQKDFLKETWTTQDAKRSLGRDAVAASSMLLVNSTIQGQADAAIENHYLHDEILRETQLPPGATYYGKVFLRHEISYRYTRLIVPFHNVDYVFDFKRQSNSTK